MKSPIPRFLADMLAKLRHVSKLLFIAFVAMAFGVLGLYALRSSRAATPAASVEAEGGVRGGGTSLVADTTASGAAAIKFMTSTSGTLHAGTKIAYIGDSLTWQDGQGEDLTQAALQAVGWPASGNSNYFYQGCSGKQLNAVDGCNTTTVQNIQQARSQLGGEPDLWVIALGTNDDQGSPADWQPALNAVLGALGGNARLLWVNDGTIYGTGDDINAFLASILNSRPHTLIADWATYILAHNASGATVANNSAAAIINTSSLWSDGVHMTTTGWKVRDAFVAAQTLQAMALP